MSVEIHVLRGEDATDHLTDLARLRIAVFRDWPYLYDGDLDYERRYLAAYAAPGAVVVGAFEDGAMVGAATAAPLEDHDAAFASVADALGTAAGDVYYLAESVLLPSHRGRGLGHAFFDRREAEARRLSRSHAAFCAVVRPRDHPARPERARDLEPFWRGRGYAPVDGAVAWLAWRDAGEAEETEKPLRFWSRAL